ncbi:Retrovirus-related Pol polyprotein [Labeo rohita]|uniref:ribonuclease H n=1 Tax=Labeo rohita TaxID=84645 RepID=A0ABQ8LD85_LABRO|nr:Retrovirus-related Pol polyprotein [Labeo rohita]
MAEPLLFSVWEVPQASTWFSPFELLYGQQPHGVLDVLREIWEAQHRQSQLYNRDTQLHKFAPGENVLVLLPTASSKLLAKWQGLFEWREEESVMLVMVVSGEDDLGPELPTRPQSLALALGGDHFSPSQLTDNIAKLQNCNMFSPLPGRTDLIQHHIGMELGVVVRSRPYRLPEYKKKVVQTELEAMLEMGVNAVSKFKTYPMPRVDELLDWLATFQRLMDKILWPHAAYAAAYLDDIIIYSNDWQRHMEHLWALLRVLRGAGLTANPKKCAIGRVEVRYLGFHLGHGQVRPQISKTAAIATCPRPKTKKEVRQFLGLAGYYRRFIPNYLDLTSSLTDLTKKEAPDPVQWTELCQQAFIQVKAALRTHRTEGLERSWPVLYISRKLSKRETMYSTIEKECLAIRWAILTLCYYLLGREFTFCSDHAPLQWLHRMKDTNAQITRCYLALKPYKYKLVHRLGAQMAMADFLSRNAGQTAPQAVGVCGEGGVV